MVYHRKWCKSNFIIVFKIKVFSSMSIMILYLFQQSYLQFSTFSLNINGVKYQNKSQTLPTNFGFELPLRAYQINIQQPSERPERCYNCFLRPYRFITKSPWICRRKKIDLLVVIHSSPGHRHQRYHIRGTWAKGMNRRNTSKVRYVFLIGNSPLKRRSREKMRSLVIWHCRTLMTSI